GGEIPGAFAFGVYLADEFGAADERVAVLEAHSGPWGGGHVNRPDLLAAIVVLADLFHVHVSDDDRAGFGETGVAELAMGGAGFANRQHELPLGCAAGFVDHE